MPLWLVVLLIIWVPLACWLSVLLGAFLMYSKQTKSNPMTGIRASLDEMFARSGAGDKEDRSFYD